MSRKRVALLIVCVVVFAGSVGGGGYLLASSTSDNTTNTQELERVTKELAKEGATRQHQFCRVILSAHIDKVKRLRNTIEYLHTPAGHEPSAINEYIRLVSLPQTKAEVEKENKRIPDVCREKEEA